MNTLEVCNIKFNNASYSIYLIIVHVYSVHDIVSQIIYFTFCCSYLCCNIAVDTEALNVFINC